MDLIIKNKKYRLLIFSFLFFHHSVFVKSFLFSVIISIYNTGRYIDESINSLINQTIGFEYIQVILVSDGNTDYSEEKCFKFQNLYPKKIF